MTRKTYQFILSLMLVIMLLAGCGKKADTNIGIGLNFMRDGSVVHQMYEEFEESYYDLDELKAQVQRDITAYNNSVGSEAITINDASVENGRVLMSMTYSKPEHYTAFYRAALFCGTIKEAFNAGYDLNVTLYSVADGEEIGKQEILEMSDRHIIIMREACPIYCCDEILYAGDSIDVGKDMKSAITYDSENLSYIIYK